MAAACERPPKDSTWFSIDADKVRYPDYFRWAPQLARKGTLIIGDHVVRDGALADPESADANVRAVQENLSLVAAEPSVTATIVQTVGSKGCDGFALAMVLADRAHE